MNLNVEERSHERRRDQLFASGSKTRTVLPRFPQMDGQHARTGKGGKTLLVLHELYPSKEALDAAGTGAADAMSETFEQLDELLGTLGASVGRS
jgi:hypothetical protein